MTKQEKAGLELVREQKIAEKFEYSKFALRKPLTAFKQSKVLLDKDTENRDL